MKIMVLLEIEASGDKIPRTFSRSIFSDEFASQKAYIVIDDLHEKIFLWLGREISRVHRRVAQRSSGFARGHGHNVEGYVVVGRSYAVIEINEGEDELPPELLEIFDHKLEHHDTHSVIVSAPGDTISPVKPISVPDETHENFEQLVTKIEDDGAEAVESPIELELAPGVEPSSTEVANFLRVEERDSSVTNIEVVDEKEDNGRLTNSITLPKLSELPPDQKHIYIEGLIQEVLLTIEKEGMVSHGSEGNSFILFSKEGDLLGTVLLESGAADELAYRANWIREDDEEQFSRLLTMLCS
jgi:hypothetical protein